MYLDTDPLKALSALIGHDYELVHEVAIRYPDPLDQTPEAFRSYREWCDINLRLANAASALAEELKSVNATDCHNGFEERLGLSVSELNAFAALCYEERDGLSWELERSPRRGGKRRDALIVASIVHDIFAEIDRPISAQHVSGEPVAEFGKTVKAALQIWKIHSDWRRASEAAIRGERIFAVRSDAN